MSTYHDAAFLVSPSSSAINYQPEEVTDKFKAPSNPTTSKVSKVFQAILGVGLLLLPPTWIALGIVKYQTSKKNNLYRESLAIRQWELLNNHFEHYQTEGNPELSSHITEIQRLLAKVKRRETENGERYFVTGGGSISNLMLKVRKELDLAFKTTTYLDYRSDLCVDRDADIENQIEQLQIGATLMLTKVKSGHEFRDYGWRAVHPEIKAEAVYSEEADIEGEENNYTIKEVVDIMDEAVHRPVQFNKDGIIGKIFYAVMHPVRVYRSVKGETVSGALNYNPYENGNFNALGWTYKVGDKEVDFYFSPQTTSDSLYEAMLDYYQAKGITTGRHILEGIEKKGERERRQAIISIRKLRKGVKESEETPASRFLLFSTHINGEAWKGKKEFKGKVTPQEYFKALRAYLKKDHNDNGFFLPDDVISKKELKATFTLAKNIFSTYEFPPDWSAKRRQQAMLLGFEGLLALKVLIKLSDESSSDDNEIITSFMQACKQDIDRGVAFNVMTRMLFTIASGRAFTKEDIYIMTGVLVGRAGIVDDRKIIEERMQSLKDFFTVLGRLDTSVLSYDLRVFLDLHLEDLSIVESFNNPDRREDGIHMEGVTSEEELDNSDGTEVEGDIGYFSDSELSD